MHKKEGFQKCFFGAPKFEEPDPCPTVDKQDPQSLDWFIPLVPAITISVMLMTALVIAYYRIVSKKDRQDRLLLEMDVYRQFELEDLTFLCEEAKFPVPEDYHRALERRTTHGELKTGLYRPMTSNRQDDSKDDSEDTAQDGYRVSTYSGPRK